MRSVSSAFIVALAAGAFLMPLRAEAASGPLVQTQEGPVQGFLKNGVAEFLGIPYAAPPVGNLRWRPPEKHASWTKVLQATAYGPTCAQITELGVFAGPPNNNEDCLYLNVFSPDVNPADKEKLPVIVWIHGGGNVDGESNDYDASKLAAQGHTVVVTLNYRLGLLGFFAHPAIDQEGHLFGNYGILDQQFVLKWVQRNIASFGGDRNNVTVGGQSAGSEDTESNVISPLAKGLFNHAILQSVTLEPSPLATAESLGTAFAVAAGCGSGATPNVAACLRKLSAAQIMSLEGTPQGSGPYVNATGMIEDGQILPSETYVDAIKNGQFNHMPIMSGTTEDEWTFLLAIEEYFEKPRVPFSAANYTAQVNSYTGSEVPYGIGTYPSGTPAKVKALYPLGSFTTPELALDRILTDPIECEQRNTNRLFASQVPVYAYEFDDRTAPSYYPAMPGLQMLAYHTGDIQYLFPLYHGGPLGVVHQLNAQQEKLSDELVAAWTNFAWTGNPNGQGNGPWPLYTPQKPNVPSILSQNSPVLTNFTDAQFSAAHQCKFWDSTLTY
ncbi:MAG TPA: carboxylesterase family protein [Methylovirgula sp.]|nr:carboxylesterase family protein [Methylovirgula sp.]